ncbi:hypothetical protein ACVIHA_008139 [Bradyrhizobium liaoningense]
MNAVRPLPRQRGRVGERVSSPARTPKRKEPSPPLRGDLSRKRER